LRTLTTVNEQYRTRFERYADSLPNLHASDYIDGVLATGEKKGYRFTYVGDENVWSCTADPTYEDAPFFYVDYTGVIRFRSSGAASAEDAPIDH